MSELPPGWVTAKVVDLVDVGPKNNCSDRAVVGFVPMSHMGKRFRDIPKFESRQWSAVKKGFTHFADGDVLLARITPCFENGKAGIPRGLPNGVGAGSTEYVVLRPKAGGILAELLLALFKTEEFLSHGAHSMTGAVGQQRVPKAVIESYPMNVPPFAEQGRIARKIETLLEKVDACRERLDRVPQILKKFREAVLEAAVSGRLTEEWRVSADASHIDNELHCIDAVRINSWRNHNRGVAKKSVEPLRPFLDKIPPNWRWVSLDRLALLVVDGTHYTPTYVAHGVPFISVKDIRGEQIHMDNCKYISAAEHKELSKRCHAQTGDLLVTKSGTIGRVAVVGEEGEFSLFVSVALVKPVPDLVSTHYLSIAFRAWLNSIDVASEITGTGIKNLHIRDLRRVPIPLPPLEEQRRIVRRADELIERECRLRGRYEMIAARIGKLTPSVLAQAFRGELVPQDPNDEPTGEMLERVRAVHAGETAATMKIRAARSKGS